MNEPIMSTSKQAVPSCTSPIWEDLVNDFLEMACFLSEGERSCLIQDLGRTGIAADEILAHPSFSIEKRLVSVCENVSVDEFWLYYPRERKIQKIPCNRRK